MSEAMLPAGSMFSQKGRIGGLRKNAISADTDNMIRMGHISDGHGYLPTLDAALGLDLLAFTGDEIAEYHGDLTRQTAFVENALGPWLVSLGIPVVGIPGNHTHIAGTADGLALLRRVYAATGGCYLVDEAATVCGLSMYGTPWTKPTNDSVYIAEEIELANKWAMIPEGLDVALTHSPPAGWRDRGADDGAGFGSTTLRERISIVRPRVHGFGHVHAGAGVDGDYSTLFSNGSIVGSGLLPVGSMTVVVFNDDGSVDYERHTVPMVDYLKSA